MAQDDSSSKRSTQRSWFCNGMFFVLAGLMASVVFPDRPSKFDYDLLDQTMLDSDVALSRHRDPLRMKIDRSLIPDMLELSPTSKVVGELEARDFIDTEILPVYDKPTDADAQNLYKSFELKMLTPLHATMMFMGCYGYVYGDKQNSPSTTKTTSGYLQDNRLWKDYTTPFMLQALEDKYSVANIHDRSVCSCMKDFANPTLVILKDDENPLDKAVQDKLIDSCSLQNTIDYAMAGPSENVLVAGADKTALSKSVLLSEMASADSSNRQRQDPLKKLVELAQAASGVVGTAVIDADKLEFIKAYCDISPSSCLGTPQTTTSPSTLTNSEFFTFLLDRVNFVKSHNKLRPPKLCSGADGTLQQCSANLAQQSASSVSAATYNAYIMKYRHAFNMCSRAGVPQYTTLRVGRIRPHRVYNIGQCFLLLAALFAFTWSFMIAHYLDSYKTEQIETINAARRNDSKSEDDYTDLLWEKSEYRYLLYGGSLAVVVAWIFLIIAFARGWFWNGSADDSTEQDNQIPHETDGTSTFFIVFFWLVSIGFVVVFTYLQMKFLEISRNDFGTVYSKAIKWVKDRRGMTSGSELFATMIANARNGNYHTQVDEFNKAVTLHLQSLAPYAQIALDLAVIAGLTTIGVASVAQRGIQDINVISATSLWFLSIGFLAHLSNMLRLIHVYLQWQEKSSYSVHVQKAAHHRLYLTLLLALMLFVYTMFAGMDSGSTTSSHAVFHQIVFALVALAVLCGSDVVEHLAGTNAKVDKDYKATVERFWLHMSTRNYYIAWILMLALLLLHLHRAKGICEASKGKFGTADCLFLSKY